MTRIYTLITLVLLALVAGQVLGEDKDGKKKCNTCQTLEALSAQVEALSAILTPKTVFVTNATFN